MIQKYEVKKLQLNTPLRGFSTGHVVRVRCDASGNPIDIYWRRRLKDAQIDGCVEFIQEKQTKSMQKQITSENKEQI